ncbi:MAG: hypothetical protein ACREIH_09120 [Nitrospiraceae bacterium]
MANRTATAWLQKRGLIIVEGTQVQGLLDKEPKKLTKMPDDSTLLLQVGMRATATLVVFIDTQDQVTSKLSRDEPGPPRTVLIHNARVSVRAIDPETSEILWHGEASVTEDDPRPEEMIEQLTCQALATAWGFRPPGKYEISSSRMCKLRSPLDPPPPE